MAFPGKVTEWCAISNRQARERNYRLIVVLRSSTIRCPSRGGFFGGERGFHYARRFFMSGTVDNPLFHRGTAGKATSRDQRRFRRYDIKLPCRVKPRASRKSATLPELEVETLDVSSGGLFFLASAEWSIGTAIEFELELPAHGVRRPVRIRCRGTITRVVPQEEGRIGIGATIDHYKFCQSTDNNNSPGDFSYIFIFQKRSCLYLFYSCRRLGN